MHIRNAFEFGVDLFDFVMRIGDIIMSVTALRHPIVLVALRCQTQYLTCVDGDSHFGRVWVCQSVVMGCDICLSPGMHWHSAGAKDKVARFAAVRGSIGVSMKVLHEEE